MAQFDHPALGGHGQWMRGGMTMIGDMFNASLKQRVAALCEDLTGFLSDRSVAQSHDTGERPSSFMASSMPGNGAWWPEALGSPNSSGAQNGSRYAYFAEQRRLAIQTNGEIALYDTGAHRIGGISQQQSSTGVLGFTSQHGDVDLTTLAQVAMRDFGKEGKQQAGTAPQGPERGASLTGEIENF